MPLIELSPENLSRLDAIRSAKGLSREAALEEILEEVQQYAHLDPATRAAILAAPILTLELLRQDTDPTALPLEDATA